MSSENAVLVVNANSEVVAAVLEVFGKAQWDVVHVPDNEAALTSVQGRRFDIVVTSEQTCAAEDVDLLCSIRRVHPHTKVVILAGDSTPAGVIAAMRARAFSYFTAPLDLASLKHIFCTAAQAPPWDDGIELRAATPDWIELSTRCDYSVADRLVQFVNEITANVDLEDKADLSVAFREMLLNAMEHGANFDPDKHVEIRYLRSKRAVSCVIRDPGKGFSMDRLPHAAISNPPDDPCAHMEARAAQGLRPGGLGILMAGSFIDELIYNEAGNEVLLIKHLDKPHTT